MCNRPISLLFLFWMGMTCFCMPLRADAQDLSFLSDTTRYLWPTDASSVLSSTFGETRSAHFHAGLDIRTWGREGYQVYATRDGIVHSLAIGPRGYGKVIYLQHDDNSFSVYAHLHRFEESLMALADSVRLQDYSFRLEKNLVHRQIRVRQGELIGYTGSTGVGPPHLHFELRTPENEPFNPLLTNLRVEDTLPPVFTGLGIEHLDSRTFRPLSRETRTAAQDGHHYDFGTIRTNGPVGISANVHDRANQTPNVYAVYELTLIHEQDTLFHSRVDAFDYSNASQMFIDRVFPLLKERRQGFQRLFQVNGNELPFYQSGPTRGIIDLEEGIHELTVVAGDFYGNQATAAFRLEVTERDQPPSENITSIPAYPDNGNVENLPNLYFSKQSSYHPFRTHFAASGLARIGPNMEEPREPPVFERVDGSRAVKKLVPGKRQFLSLPDQTIWVEFPRHSLFDTLYAEMRISEKNGLPVVQFSPELVPLRESAFLNIMLPGHLPETVGAYSYDRQRNRHLFRGAGMPGRLLRVPITELEEIHLLHDRNAPYVGPASIEADISGMIVVFIPVLDEMSGIDYLRSSIEVNGERGITEYDPDKNLLIYYNPDFQPRSVNEIDVQVYDQMGNLLRRSSRVEY